MNVDAATRRFRLPTWAFLALVLATGTAIGLAARSWDRERRRAVAWAQLAAQKREMLSAVLLYAQWVDPGHPMQINLDDGGRGPGWSFVCFHAAADPDTSEWFRAVHVRVSGVVSPSGEAEVVVQDFGARLNGRALDSIRVLCAKRGWSVRVVGRRDDPEVEGEAGAFDQAVVLGDLTRRAQADGHIPNATTIGFSYYGPHRGWYQQLTFPTPADGSTRVTLFGGPGAGAGAPLRIWGEGGPEAAALADRLREECQRRGWQLEWQSAESGHP